ncbi:hypothetical protein VNO80_34909 [Phaseolus coccineus]|uniref:ATP synthase epsilon chain, chloroplastic n=1 Tax=Phaseolus coccineus TaxID=3886 RepID=A0AAN9KTS6_PHACN
MGINPTTSGPEVSSREKKNLGHIVQIIGPVLDVAFPPGKMPNIYNALVVKGRDTVGQQINVTCEVQQLLGNNRVRAVAMSATDGLMRGMEVIDTGTPLSVPVDDLTDPAPATTFAHLDATTVLSRGLAAKEMTLNLCVLTPNRIVWDSEVKEIILPTNSGQIGVLPNHAPIASAVDIGILRIRLKDQWLTMALMGGFARINNNEITVLVNDAEKGSDIDPQEAQQTLEIAETNLNQAEGKRQTIEANLTLRRARTRVEAINIIS